MPQASDEERKLMGKWFGDDIDDWGPTRFLLSHGFTEHGGLWEKPTASHAVSCYEHACLLFLCNEWDHGFDFGKFNVICLCGEVSKNKA